jgi:hypothetical protein
LSYWSNEIDGSDFAFGGAGVAILWIKDRMFRDLDIVVGKSHPEQSLGVYLCSLRLLGVRFRKELSVHFGRRDLERARKGFEEWYELVRDKITSDRRNPVYKSVIDEFHLFDEQIFGGRSNDDLPSE